MNDLGGVLNDLVFDKGGKLNFFKFAAVAGNLPPVFGLVIVGFLILRSLCSFLSCFFLSASLNPSLGFNFPP